MRIIWSPRASRELDSEVAWIARSRPLAAERWLAEVNRYVLRLSHFPESGRRVPDYPDLDVREVIVGQYRVCYALEVDHILVLTIQHSRELLALGDLTSGLAEDG